MSSETEINYWSVLPQFFRELEANGIKIPSSLWGKIYVVLTATPSIENLRWRLLALLTNSPKEQDVFLSVFDQYFIQIDSLSTSFSEEKPPIEREKKDVVTSLKKNTKKLDDFFTGFFMLLVFICVFIFFQEEILSFFEFLPRIVGQSILLLPLIILLVFGIYEYLRLSNPLRAILRVDYDFDALTYHALSIPDIKMIKFDGKYIKIAKQLRQRISTEQYILDVKRTIQTSAKEGGFLVPHYKKTQQTPSYLLLIDVGNGENHNASLYETLHQFLRLHGVIIERFYYRKSPVFCWNEYFNDGLNLDQLENKYSDHRLLIFSHGWQFLHPRKAKLADWTDQLLTWRERFLFTPISPTQWSQREEILQEYFNLAPATVRGFELIGNYFDPDSQIKINPDSGLSWEQEPPVRVEADTLGTDLINILPDENLQIWLQALSCYPQLSWKLTLFIGERLSDQLGVDLLTYENIRCLTRFSWFYNGIMPDAIRAKLYAMMDEKTRSLVHLTIYDWLADQELSTTNIQEETEEGEQKIWLALHKAAAGQSSESEIETLRTLLQNSGYGAVIRTTDYAAFEEQMLPANLIGQLTDNEGAFSYIGIKILNIFTGYNNIRLKNKIPSETVADQTGENNVTTKNTPLEEKLPTVEELRRRMLGLPEEEIKEESSSIEETPVNQTHKRLQEKDTHYIFVYGSPASGKTSFIASLLMHLRNDKRGTLTFRPSQDVIANQRYYRELEINLKEYRRFFPPTGSNINELDLTYTNKNKNSASNFTLLELSGESLESSQILVNEQKQSLSPFEDYIKCPGIKRSFIITVPHNANEVEGRSWTEIDYGVVDFMYYLQTRNTDLEEQYFLCLITKWDTYKGKHRTANSFMKDFLPMTYQRLSNKKASISPYSVGQVVKARDENNKGVIVDFVQSLNFEYAEKVREWLFRIVPPLK